MGRKNQNAQENMHHKIVLKPFKCITTQGNKIYIQVSRSEKSWGANISEMELEGQQKI